jgi:hypothetical protein
MPLAWQLSQKTPSTHESRVERGRAQKKHLVSYLRDHPEELRPFLTSRCYATIRASKVKRKVGVQLRWGAQTCGVMGSGCVQLKDRDTARAVPDAL